MVRTIKTAESIQKNCNEKVPKIFHNSLLARVKNERHFHFENIYAGVAYKAIICELTAHDTMAKIFINKNNKKKMLLYSAALSPTTPPVLRLITFCLCDAHVRISISNTTINWLYNVKAIVAHAPHNFHGLRLLYGRNWPRSLESRSTLLDLHCKINKYCVIRCIVRRRRRTTLNDWIDWIERERLTDDCIA